MTRRIGRMAIAVAVPLFGIYLILDLLGLDPFSACITEPRGQIINLVGFDFEITETNCDALAKEDWISVFVSKKGVTHRTLLFQYDPGGGDIYPVITSIGQHDVKIEVSWISSVRFRRDGLKGLTVSYSIGRIDYTATTNAQ